MGNIAVAVALEEHKRLTIGDQVECATKMQSGGLGLILVLVLRIRSLLFKSLPIHNHQRL